MIDSPGATSPAGHDEVTRRGATDGGPSITAIPRSGTTSLGADLLSIQYLRGVAAIGVLIFHAADATGRSFRVGGSGVDIFFVISGLIMWTIGARRPLTPREFLLRRVIRVVPLYWFVTLALAGTWLILPNVYTIERLGANGFDRAGSTSSCEPRLISGPR